MGRSVQGARGGGGGRVALAAVVVLAWMMASLAVASEETPIRAISWSTGPLLVKEHDGALPEWLPTRRDGARDTFLQGYLVKNVNRQLDKVGSTDLAVFPGQSLVDHVYFQATTARTRRGMERATVRAFRSYMLEETTLGRVLTGFDRGPLFPGLGRAVTFDVGVAHGAPKLFVKPRLDAGGLRLSLDSRAAVGVEYRNERLLRRTRVAASLDALRQRYSVYALFGF